MKKRLLVLAALTGACAPGETESDAAAVPGDTASMYAARLMETLGGADAWARTRYLSFRFIVERGGQTVVDRAHSWDRYEGRYRLELDREEGRLVAIFNEKTYRTDPELGKVPAGDAWVNGRALAGTARDSALAGAFRAFINDTYWLLMPYKWGDDGVHLTYEGQRTLDDGNEYAVIHLTFDQGLGVTEDQYWAYLDPETGALAAWNYHLQGRDEPGQIVWWKEWTPVGGIRFSMDRRSEGSGIRFADVVASETVPEGRFDPPASAPAPAPAPAP